MASLMASVVLITLFAVASGFPDCDSGEVRLVGGNSHLLGRVELCFNNVWGTVCGIEWDDTDASVVCSQLGFSPSEALSVGNGFGGGSGPILLVDVLCVGTEQRLLDCPQSFPVGSGVSECSHTMDAGVACQPQIFEVGVRNSFRITYQAFLTEVTPQATYSSLLMAIAHAFSAQCFGSDSTVNTRCFENDLISLTGNTLRSNPLPILGSLLQNFTSIVIPSSVSFSPGNFSATFYYLIYYQNIELVLRGGKALELIQANSSVFTAVGVNIVSSFVVFNCSLVVCLNGGTCVEGSNQTCQCSPEYSGERCEMGVTFSCTMVMSCFNGGTCIEVVRDGITMNQCQCPHGFDGDRCQVDLPFCTAFTCMNGASCMDLVGEDTICLCLPGFTGTQCETNEACSTGDVRLQGGSNHLEGRVEYCVDNEWGTVCSQQWDDQNTAVVCAQLGFLLHQGSVTSGHNMFEGGKGPIFLSNVNCVGTERRLSDCQATTADCEHDQDIGVMCLPQIYHQTALMNAIRVTAKSQAAVDILFVNTLQRGCVMAFYEYCFNSDNLGCFERDLTGRQANTPLALSDIQNISAIVVPNSLQAGTAESIHTIDLYFLIYYQQGEAAIIDTTALSIVQVDVTIFSDLGITEISFSLPVEVTTQQTLPTIVTTTTEVFCAGETDSKWRLVYPNTAVAMVVSRPCPDSQSVSTAMTTRLCMENGEWSEIDVSACEREAFRNISTIATNVFNTSEVDPEAVEAVLSDLVVATTPSAGNPVSQFPRDLDTTNEVVGLTVDYLMRGLQSGDPTDLSTQVVDIISNVLDGDNEGGWTAFSDEEAGSERLLENAEQYGVYFAAALLNANVSINQTDIQDNTIARDNIIINAESVDPNNVSDILFPKVVKVGQFGSAQSKLSQQFLVDLGAERNALSAVNVIFNNLNRFLPKDGLTNTTQPATNVISTQVVTIEGSDVSVMKSSDFTNNPAEFRFTTIEFGDDKVAKDPVCAFWDFGNVSSELSRSLWSSEGVETKIIAENETSKTFTVECKSPHLTSFAVLLDVNDALSTVDPKQLLALTYVTYIGCGISICFLFLSILFFTCIIRKELLKNVHYFIHLNLCIALFLAYVTFLAGVDTAVKYRVACVFVAALIHYLFLCVFCWMLCEGIMLYLMLVVVFSNLSKKWWLFLMLGWGPPIIIVAISVGIVHEQYGTDTFCWISASDPKVGALWAFAAPMLAIIIVNIFFLLAALRSLYKVRRTKAKHKSEDNQSKLPLFKELLLATLILLPLLGLTWVFGLLSINRETTVFAWIFTICNSLQGLCIFIFHVLRNERVCGRRNRSTKGSTIRSRTTGLFSRLRKGTGTTTRYQSSTTIKGTIKSARESTVKNSSFMSQESDSVEESKVLSATSGEKHKSMSTLAEMGDFEDDELSGLDTKMFKSRSEDDDSSDDMQEPDKEKFEYTMTVSWMSK